MPLRRRVFQPSARTPLHAAAATPLFIVRRPMPPLFAADDCRRRRCHGRRHTRRIRFMPFTPYAAAAAATPWRHFFLPHCRCRRHAASDGVSHTHTKPPMLTPPPTAIAATPIRHRRADARCRQPAPPLPRLLPRLRDTPTFGRRYCGCRHRQLAAASRQPGRRFATEPYVSCASR